MTQQTKTKICTSQKYAVETYGDKVWEWLCDKVYTGKTFTHADVGKCPVLQHLTKSTKQQYVRAILQDVILKYENNPKDCPIKRISIRAFLMVE